jgi:Acyl-CoA carboxylase epsilon subunit
MTADTPGLAAAAGPGAATGTSGLAVVAGQPTAEDLAALTAALAAVLARAAADRAVAGTVAGRRGGGWADRARLLRPPLVPGPGAWRRSARP